MTSIRPPIQCQLALNFIIAQYHPKHTSELYWLVLANLLLFALRLDCESSYLDAISVPTSWISPWFPFPYNLHVQTDGRQWPSRQINLGGSCVSIAIPSSSPSIWRASNLVSPIIVWHRHLVFPSRSLERLLCYFTTSHSFTGSYILWRSLNVTTNIRYTLTPIAIARAGSLCSRVVHAVSYSNHMTLLGISLIYIQLENARTWRVSFFFILRPESSYVTL